MGVKRAVDRVIGESRKGEGPYYSLGPLIHNRQAVDVLEKRGIRCINDLSEVSKGSVIVRAHGLPPKTVQEMEDRGFEIIDATCPRVRHSQNIIRKFHKQGYRIIIAGDKDHAEVTALLGYCDNTGTVITSLQEAASLELDGKACLVAQTTFNEKEFLEMVEAVKARHAEVEVVNTICRSTEDRQRETAELCRAVDAMVVVGGKHSANTRRLAEIAQATGTPTVHVETADELPGDMVQYKTVGVTAGASTPNWITASVINRLKYMGDQSNPARHLIMRGLRFLINSTIYTGFGAAALTCAGFALQHENTISLKSLHLLVSFIYIYCVHVWNRVTEPDIDELNAPPRVAFFLKRPLLPIAIAALAAGSMVVSAWLGVRQALLLLAAYVVALAYNIPLGSKKKPWRLKDVPASKEFFTATGWTAVAIVAPALSAPLKILPLSLAVVVAYGLVFLRTAMIDFTDIQGDRLLGRETLPVFLGARRARNYMELLAVVLIVLIAAATFLGVFSSVGWWMLSAPLLILAVLRLFFDRITKSELVCPYVADGFLLLPGLIAVIWRLTV